MTKSDKLKDILDLAIPAWQNGEWDTALQILKEHSHLYPIFQDKIEQIEILISDSHSLPLTTGSDHPVGNRIGDLIKDIETANPEELTNIFSLEIFPKHASFVPFGNMLESLFFGEYDEGYPVHGPNVVRFTKALLDDNSVPGLYKIEAGDDNPQHIFSDIYYKKIMRRLTEIPDHKQSAIIDQAKKESIKNLLYIAALYHDIGKCIKSPKHPEIGANLIRNFDEKERLKLVIFLGFGENKELIENRQNRFSLLTSIINHHDKFGVVSTGEGGMPIFSNILYFTSSEKDIEPIKKNVTAVMLANLADIAAVITQRKHPQILKAYNKATELREIRTRAATQKISNSDIHLEQNILEELKKICEDEELSLGLSGRKVKKVLQDWEDLIGAIDDAKGDRLKLKIELLNRERNPTRTIERVFRLVEESIITAEAPNLISNDELSKALIESTLINILGNYQFESFCEKLATVVKLDYGLKFFQSIVCASIRKEIYRGSDLRIDRKEMEYLRKHHQAFLKDNKSDLEPSRLHAEERNKLNMLSSGTKSALIRRISTITVKVLVAIISRYSGIFDLNIQSGHRFGIQMGDLSKDRQIWRSIVEQLCLQEDKESFALSWMIDEVTIWPFD